MNSPLGKLFEVDGHQMHIHITGKGGPSVIFESGGASWSMDWTLVQNEVSKFTTACSYDRSGFGWSDPGTKPRHAIQIESELHSLLIKAEIKKPYILVGSSFGGHVMRLYASKHPNDVAGVILLDARHEAINSKMPSSWKKMESTGRAINQFMLFISRIGLMKLFGTLMGKSKLPPIVKHLSPELRSKYLRVGFRSNFFRANEDELDAISESDDQVRSARSLGDIPLVVIQHGIADLFQSMPSDQATKAETVWHGLQVDLANLSSNSALITATKSGHAIQVNQPEIVIKAIYQMIENIQIEKQ